MAKQNKEKENLNSRVSAVGISGVIASGRVVAVLFICLVLVAALLTWTVHSRYAVESSTAETEIAKDVQASDIDPMEFVGAPTIASAGGEGIHESKWTPREDAPWICVVRAKDPAMRLKIAQAMTQALELHQVGYSGDKEKRQTLYQEAAKVDFDLTKVTAECYTSCTSVASVALRAAGYPEDVAPQLVYSDSLSEKTNLRKHLTARPELFDAFTTEDYTASADKLQAGDILFSEHHVAIVIRSANPVN